MQTPLSTLRARELRRGSTQAEHQLWEVLRARRLGGWKWRRQVPCGPFIIDFLCPEARLAVELDGGQHGEEAAELYDARRTAYLRHQGLTVLRFWNSHVLSDRYSVCDAILRACDGTRFIPQGIDVAGGIPLPLAGEGRVRAREA